MSPAYVEKLARAQARLAELGVPRSTIAPPVYRAAWKLGVELPPPLFASFGFLFLVQAILFATLWGLGMLLFVRLAGLFIPAFFVAFAALAAGLSFGVVMALLIHRKAKQLALPPWESF